MPQIEIMMTDTPHTLFKKDKKKAGGKGRQFSKEDIEKMNEMNARLAEKKKKLTVDDVFNGALEE